MIQPTDKDIGSRVVYTAWHNHTERGTIMSFNDKFVFVRYDSPDKMHGNVSGPKATRRENLQWADEYDKKPMP